MSATGFDAALARLRARIEATGTDPAAVTLVAVTKGHGAERAAEAATAGIMDLGESYAQELLPKAAALATAGVKVRWHFLGQVQRNKVKALAPHVHLWQSLDRIEVAEAIARHAPGAGVLVQVNLTQDAARGGVGLAQVPALVEQAAALGLDVRGLMAVGPPGPAEASVAGFEAVATMADRLALAERSMGMSGDLQVALRSGATMLRVGSALFGPRADGPRPEPQVMGD